MITLPVEKINEFFKLASVISSDKSDNLPVLKYLKIEIVFGSCIITKHNQNSYCKYIFDTNEEDCEFLIDQKKLEGYCLDSTSATFTIDIKNTLVTLNDGYSETTYNSETYLVSDFLKIPETNNESVRIDSATLKALSVARVCTAKDKLIVHFTPVYMDGKVMYSSSMETFYVKSFSRDLPKIAVGVTECEVLKNFDFVDYSISDNFNTYKFGRITYGFIQPEGLNGFDYNFVLKKIKKDNYIKFKKEHFLRFCKSTIRFYGTFKNSTLSAKDGKLTMLFLDKEKSEKNIIEVDCEMFGEGFDFHFSPKTWSEVIESLPYDEICFGNEGDEKGLVSIWNDSDPDYIGAIQKQFLF